MSKFVVDEWLWADLQGDNGKEMQRESLSFLLKVFHRCDQLVTVEGSPFLKKFYDLCEKAGTMGDPRRKIVRLFKDMFFLNSSKLLRLQESGLPELPQKIATVIKEDDHYLVRAYFASQAQSLVTTDDPLIAAVKGCCINCQSRKDFLSDYKGVST